MNKEYYQAKADLCRDLFVQQVTDNKTDEAGKNLLRMVNALTMVNLIEQKEGKNNA